MNLDFLNEISLEKTEVKQRVTALNTVPEEGASLRLFRDGRVYPAAQFAEDNSLEYTDKGTTGGNGLDFIDTEHFAPYQKTGGQRLVMTALVPKESAKVDMFGSVGYDEQGKAKTSVLEQGAKTFGVTLITMLEEVYGNTLFEDNKYVDLVVSTEYGLNTPNDIYNFPKVVSRGINKGELTYIRRINTTLWPVTIFNVEETEEVTEDILEEEIVETSKK